MDLKAAEVSVLLDVVLQDSVLIFMRFMRVACDVFVVVILSMRISSEYDPHPLEPDVDHI